MRTIHALVAAAILAGVLCLAMLDVATTTRTTTRTEYKHKACPDCIVMLVNFVPPKP
jgi:hypothetical protein